MEASTDTKQTSSNTTSLPLLQQGLSLHFLVSLSSALQEDSNLKDITTRTIVELLTTDNSTTSTPTLSIAALLHSKQNNKRSIDGKDNHPIVSTPTIFLCHCWDYRLFNLIDTLITHYPQSQWQSTFIWMDVFCLSPSQLCLMTTNTTSAAYWCTAAEFQADIAKIGKAIVVNAKTETYNTWLTAPPLRDAKCVWELHCIAQVYNEQVITDNDGTELLTVLVHNQGEERKVHFQWLSDYERTARTLIDSTIQEAKTVNASSKDMKNGGSEIVSLLTKSLMHSLETIVTTRHAQFVILDEMTQNTETDNGEEKSVPTITLYDVYYHSFGCYVLSKYYATEFHGSYYKKIAIDWCYYAKDFYYEILPNNWVEVDQLKELAGLEIELMQVGNRIDYHKIATIYEQMLLKQEEVFGKNHLDTILTLYIISYQYSAHLYLFFADIASSSSWSPHDNNNEKIEQYRQGLQMMKHYVEGLKRYTHVLGITHSAIPSCVQWLVTKVSSCHYILSLTDMQYIATHHGHSYCENVLQLIDPSLKKPMNTTVLALVHVLHIYEYMRDIDSMIEERIETVNIRIIAEALGSNFEQTLLNPNEYGTANSLSLVMKRLILQAKLLFENENENEEDMDTSIEMKLFHRIIELLEERVHQMRQDSSGNSRGGLLRQLQSMKADSLLATLLETLGKSYLEFNLDDRYAKQCLECWNECYEILQRSGQQNNPFDTRLGSIALYRDTANSRYYFCRKLTSVNVNDHQKGCSIIN